MGAATAPSPRSSSNCPAGQTNNSKKLRRRETKDLWAQLLETGIPAQSSSSKNEFQRKLDDAIVAPRQSAVPADVVGNLPKVRSREGHITASLARVGRGTRCEEIQMVGKVEGFRAQLNRLAFPDRKVPRQGQIQLKRSRALHVVIAQIPVRTRRRCEKSGAVDPIVGGLTARIWIRIHQIRRLVLHRSQRPVRACVNREKLRGPDGQDGGDLPVASQNPKRRIGKFGCRRYQIHTKQLAPIDP